MDDLGDSKRVVRGVRCKFDAGGEGGSIINLHALFLGLGVFVGP